MIRQAIIPLAGLGTRLLPLTSVFAKELLPINGKPGLEYILDECIEAGIKEVHIATIDPNSKVNGKGVSTLEAAGIKVCLGENSDQAHSLYEAYSKHITWIDKKSLIAVQEESYDLSGELRKKKQFFFDSIYIIGLLRRRIWIYFIRLCVL